MTTTPARGVVRDKTEEWDFRPLRKAQEMTTPRIWDLAEAITKARLASAWGKNHAAHHLAMMNWPLTDKERRAYEHAPSAEIDLALASARAALEWFGAHKGASA